MFQLLFQLLFVIGLVLGSAWALKAARSMGEHVVGLLPAGMFGLFWLAGGVVQILAGELSGLVVELGGQLVALLVLVAIGNQLRSRRMKEVIQAA